MTVAGFAFHLEHSREEPGENDQLSEPLRIETNKAHRAVLDALDIPDR